MLIHKHFETSINPILKSNNKVILTVTQQNLLYEYFTNPNTLVEMATIPAGFEKGLIVCQEGLTADRGNQDIVVQYQFNRSDNTISFREFRGVSKKPSLYWTTPTQGYRLEDGKLRIGVKCELILGKHRKRMETMSLTAIAILQYLSRLQALKHETLLQQTETITQIDESKTVTEYAFSEITGELFRTASKSQTEAKVVTFFESY